MPKLEIICYNHFGLGFGSLKGMRFRVIVRDFGAARVGGTHSLSLFMQVRL